MPETDSEIQNKAFNWAVLLVRELFEQGIREVVISPGSRSTALTLAFAGHPGFRKTVVIDERSAAFTALGKSKASELPAVLLCTSGTAAANYYPAVIEARQSGTPLIVLTADRPPVLRSVGASQTIDQLKLYGDYPVYFHEAGEPDSSVAGRKRLIQSVRQAVSCSVLNEGPVHINLPFRKPFEPENKRLQEVRNENEKHAARTFSAYRQTASETEFDEHFWSDLISAERPVIVAGPGAGSLNGNFISGLSNLLNAPVLAEPGSNLEHLPNTIQGFDGFLRNPDNREKLSADLILRFGAQPVSKALNLYLSGNTEGLQLAFMSPNRWTDGSSSADKHIILNSRVSIPDVTGSVPESWPESWKTADLQFKNFRDEKLKQQDLLTDGYVFDSLSRLLPDQSFIMASNSFPVRDLSMFGEHAGKEIYVNRGTAGIDGITSTAIGLSSVLNKTGVLFTGDIAFLHDSNALLNAAAVHSPLIVVVLNNGGGTIFRMLPVHDVRDSYQEYFETPQHTSLSALCRAHKTDHSLVSRTADLESVFSEHLQIRGLSVIECMTDADDSMALRETCWNFSIQSDS